MKSTIGRFLARLVQRFYGIHPEVIRLIGSGFRLTNPSNADFPSENLPLASRVIASGLWNYCFFQFYRNFAGPYWVERQYNPKDVSFIPRAGSMMSMNLTHRTWCGFRGPTSSSFGMVDPAGSVSPVVGFYSIEIGLQFKPKNMPQSKLFLATRGQLKIQQRLIDQLPVLQTIYSKDSIQNDIKDSVIVECSVSGDSDDLGSILSLISATVKEEGWSLVLGIRPFNTEGAALVDQIEYRKNHEFGSVFINGNEEIRFLTLPNQQSVSDLEQGDAYFIDENHTQANCPYGVTTAKFCFDLKVGENQIGFHARTYEQIAPAQVDLFDEITTAYTKRTEVSDVAKPKHKIRTDFIHRKELPLTNQYQTIDSIRSGIDRSIDLWSNRVRTASAFESSNQLWNQVAKAHTSFLISLQTERKITPGVFTYRQFWFRDAAYMISSLTAWNLFAESKLVLETYSARQKKDGFFRSHEGEWDSNGQAIWTLTDYHRKSGDDELLKKQLPSIIKGAQWIIDYRKKGYAKKLMPAGFSAEHLGPADFYYWDNLWSVAGLREAIYAINAVSEDSTLSQYVQKFRSEKNRYSEDFLKLTADERKKYGVLTAAPNRGIDPGMIGSIVHLYPLELDLLPTSEVQNTVNTLYQRYFQDDLFFHPIIHSGFNIYLSLQVAQCALKLGNIELARRIFNRVIEVRSNLFTYPEAIHPLTGGGVMGDGFHGWASAELLLLLREFVISEQKHNDIRIIELFRGLTQNDLFGQPVFFGPFPLRGGHIQIRANIDIELGGVLSIELNHIEKRAFNKIMINTANLAALWLSRFELNCKAAKIEIQNGAIIELSDFNCNQKIEISFNRK